ncbi:MAG: hypothetical protein WC340_18355 [Kiritimatiellia bacterium]
MIQNLDLLKKAEHLAKTRKMRVSKAATRLGLDPQAAKACSVAAEITFAETADEFVSAARDIAHSCMSETPEAYLYWYHASTDDGLRPVRVAIYRNSRCLVRIDTREFVKCYGEQSGDLHRALVWLGYTWNEHALESLTIPDKIQIGVRREVYCSSCPQKTVWDFWIEKEKLTDEMRQYVSKCDLNDAYPIVEVRGFPRPETWNARPRQKPDYEKDPVYHYHKVKVFARRPYCDGRRQFL